MLYSLAWGGFKNGEIPASLLTTVRGCLFEKEAASHLLALEAEFQEEFGQQAVILEGYRDMARQIYLYAGWVHQLPGFHLAAVPGESNHGWGRAVDFGSGVDVFDTPQKIWMDANAPRHGFWPTGNDFKPREAWHYDYRPGTATAALNATFLEDDLDTNQSQQLDFIYNALKNGGPDLPDANRSIGLSLKVLDDQLTQVVAMLPRLQEVRDAILGATAPAMPDAGRSVGGSLKAIDDLVTEIRNAVTQPVTRNGKDISQAADNAATGTVVRELLTRSSVTAEQVAAAIVPLLPAASSVSQAQLIAAVKQGITGLTLKVSE